MNRETVVRVCVVFCLCNVVLTAGLAATGVLRSVQPGDVEQIRTVEDGQYQLPSDGRHLVSEPITDADVFYNAVVLSEARIPLYGTRGYHYAPVVVLPFALLSLAGYGVFKWLLFLASVAAVAGGSYLILRAESRRRELDLTTQQLTVLALATVGFGPMVSNFKVGQISPFLYAAIAGFWYLYRTDREGVGGLLLTLPALTKPYFLAPAALVIARRHVRGSVGVVAGVAGGIGLGAAVYSVTTTLSYGVETAEYALGSEATGVPPVVEWSVEAVYPLFSLGVVTQLSRGVAAVGFTLLWLVYLASGEEESEAAGLFAASIVMVFFVIQQATNIDLAVVLAAFLVLGGELYERGSETAVLGLGGAFLLCAGHPYAMEVLVGDGHPTVLGLTPQPVNPLLQLFQPAVYGLYLLGYLAVAVFVDDSQLERFTAVAR